MNKRYSLKKRRDFQRVFRRGHSHPSRYCVLICCRNRGSELKVGFSAGKKVGNSVKRNRAKRLMREAFRSFLPELRTDLAYIVVARAGITDVSMSEVAQSLCYALEKAEAFKKV